MKNLVQLLAIFIVLMLTSCEKEGLIDDCVSSPKNLICTMDYTPVCGCNDRTYSNSCQAESAGVLFWTPGTCN